VQAPVLSGGFRQLVLNFFLFIDWFSRLLLLLLGFSLGESQHSVDFRFVVLKELHTVFEDRHGSASNSVNLLFENLGITCNLGHITVVSAEVGVALRLILEDFVCIDFADVSELFLQRANRLHSDSARTDQLSQLLGVNGGVSIGHGHALDLMEVLKLDAVVGETEQIEDTGGLVGSQAILVGLQSVVDFGLALSDLVESVLQLLQGQVVVGLNELPDLIFFGVVSSDFLLRGDILLEALGLLKEVSSLLHSHVERVHVLGHIVPLKIILEITLH